MALSGQSGYDACMDRPTDTLELLAKHRAERAKLIAHIEGLESGRIKFRDEAATAKQIVACRRDVAWWDRLIATNEARLVAEITPA
jgi:hypothetical protein